MWRTSIPVGEKLSPLHSPVNKHNSASARAVRALPPPRHLFDLIVTRSDKVVGGASGPRRADAVA